MLNYQREKKHSDDLKKAQKKAIVLECELRRKEEELIAFVEELNNKKGENTGLRQVARSCLPMHLQSRLE